MPSRPHESIERDPTSAGIPVHEFVVHPDPSTELAVLYNDFPESVGNVQAIGSDSFFEGLQKAALKQLGEGRLTYAMNSKFASHPMRELRFEVPAKRLSCEMRIIVVGHRMYQLIVVSGTGVNESAELDTFFNSFHLRYD
jgi:hypothetical protein